MVWFSRPKTLGVLNLFWKVIHLWVVSLTLFVWFLKLSCVAPVNNIAHTILYAVVIVFAVVVQTRNHSNIWCIFSNVLVDCYQCIESIINVVHFHITHSGFAQSLWGGKPAESRFSPGTRGECRHNWRVLCKLLCAFNFWHVHYTGLSGYRCTCVDSFIAIRLY